MFCHRLYHKMYKLLADLQLSEHEDEVEKDEVHVKPCVE
jgi:hypothetical protein